MGGGGPSGPTRTQQIEDRRKALEGRIGSAENITDLTRQEFTEKFGGLTSASSVIEGRTAAARARLDELKKKPANQFTQQDQQEFNSLQGQIRNADLQEEEFENLGAEFQAIEDELDAAIRGEGIFGRRQKRRATQDLLRDRPGAKQTRGGTLLGGTSEGGSLLT